MREKTLFWPGIPINPASLIIPWDIDGSWGIWWNGTVSPPRGRIENHLFIRLRETDAGNFNDKVESNWELYRSSIVNLDSLLLPIRQYHKLMILNGALKRENKRWEDIYIDPDLEYEYISTWLEARLSFLANEFD
ncbi:MAG: CotH kinase family protein [Bacteroidota bacterium]